MILYHTTVYKGLSFGYRRIFMIKTLGKVLTKKQILASEEEKLEN